MTYAWAKPPRMGQQVRYRVDQLGQTRTCTGVVMACYGCGVVVGSRGWASGWRVQVRVDQLPAWWPWSHSNEFRPALADLAPIGEVLT